ncbi:hypothetical protein L208DRAFT_1386462 [Tricholoma matsutake]|nr:hypothetical protein L208DRAFT_1386462 [Tricholoma matsutake 945]
MDTLAWFSGNPVLELEDGELVCNDPGCETLISDVDLLRCNSPGFYSPLLSNLL